MLKSILNDEALRRKTEAHKVHVDNMAASTVVSKIHAAFLAESSLLSEINLMGDYGRAVPFSVAQTARLRREDVDFMSACLVPEGLSAQLGAQLYPVALKLNVRGGSNGCISICTTRTHPFKDDAVAAVLDLHAPVPEVMRHFFTELAKHVVTAALA